MPDYEELEAERESRAVDLERRADIRADVAEARANSERGWRELPLVVLDSLAAGLVAGVGVATALAGVLFVLVARDYTVPEQVGLGALPLVSLALILIAFSVGPFRLSALRHSKIIANAVLFAWCVCVLIFMLAVIAAAGD